MPDRAAILIALCLAVVTAGAVQVLHADCGMETGEHTETCSHDHHGETGPTDHDHDQHTPDELKLFRSANGSSLKPLLAIAWAMPTPIAPIADARPDRRAGTAPSRAGPPPDQIRLRTVVLLV